MTIGSRGDVQPYIALCVGLMKDGHVRGRLMLKADVAALHHRHAPGEPRLGRVLRHQLQRVRSSVSQWRAIGGTAPVRIARALMTKEADTLSGPAEIPRSSVSRPWVLC